MFFCRLRGTGGDLVILEEAAFIAPEVWTEVVIPLVEVKNTALIAISTPLDSVRMPSGGRGGSITAARDCRVTSIRRWFR